MPGYSRFTTAVRVRPDDIDLNQHVHNSKYHDYVLAARYEQMEHDYRLSMDSFLERGLSWVVRVSRIEHKRPLKMGHIALVTTWVEEIQPRGVTVGFEITKEADGKMVARGNYDYVMVNLKTGRPQNIPDDIVAAYSI